MRPAERGQCSHFADFMYCEPQTFKHFLTNVHIPYISVCTIYKGKTGSWSFHPLFYLWHVIALSWLILFAVQEKEACSGRAFWISTDAQGKKKTPACNFILMQPIREWAELELQIIRICPPYYSANTYSINLWCFVCMIHLQYLKAGHRNWWLIEFRFNTQWSFLHKLLNHTCSHI